MTGPGKGATKRTIRRKGLRASPDNDSPQGWILPRALLVLEMDTSNRAFGRR